MKLFRYRKPSWKTVLGVTRAKKQINRALGITAAMRPFRAWGNLKRRVKRRVGYESDVGRLVRLGPPTPGGCLLPMLTLGVLVATLSAALLSP